MIDEACSKRERNRLERRAGIVAVAQQLFLEDGYAATTMNAVTEALGGSKATLWAHFRSKDELFAEVIDGMIDEVASRLEAVLGRGPASSAGLRAFAEQFLKRLFEPDATRLYRLIIAESARFPALGAMFHARGPARIRARLEAWFATANPPEKAQRLAEMTIAALVGFRANRLLLGDTIEPQEARRFVESLLETLALS